MQTQPHQNQINGSIASANCPAQIAINDIGCCDKQLDLGMVSVSGQIEQLPVDSVVNEKHNQNQNRNQREQSHGNDCQLSMVNVAVDSDSGNANAGGRELNFLNLKLQCMCSGDDSGGGAGGVGIGGGGDSSAISNTNFEPITKRNSADDETEIGISDVKAVTEIGESIHQNHRCTHCGRGHCCFFLRCCYCTANAIVQPTDGNIAIDASTNPIAMHDNNPCESECGNANRTANTKSNNIPKDLTLDSCTEIGSNQNLASKRCDEICKIIRSQHGSEMCSSSTMLAKKQCCEDGITTDANDKQCTLAKSIAIGCHCRWYCIQDCSVSDAKANAVDNRIKGETTLAVQEPEIVSPITNESALNNDENRLRCCRCSKELF